MPFENISKRKLSFAPKNLVLGEDEKELKISLSETNYSNTERIVAPNKQLFVVSSSKQGEFEKLPKLTYIEGNLSLPDECTIIAANLTRIEGNLQVGARAKFYAPMLQEVTGFITVGMNATVNAPKIEHMLSNDDTSTISEQSTTPDWLHTIGR